MLNKIAKAAARYPQAKTARRSASQLTSSLQKLEDQIKAAGKTPNPLPVLREVRASALYQEVWELLNAPNPEIMRQPNRHMNPEIRLRGQGYTVCHALDAVTDILGDHFNLKSPTRSNNHKADATDVSKTNDQAFQEQIKPGFEKKLKNEFASAWKNFDPRFTGTHWTAAERQTEELTRMAGVLSAVAPEVVADFGLSYPKKAAELAMQWGEIPPEMQLNKSELLALIDYVNSQSGTFNATNYVAIANAYYGQKVLADVTEVFSTALSGAINKLCAHPYFGRTNITAYKGIMMNNAAGPFRIGMLESAVGNGKLIAFPQVLSATSNQLASYATGKYSDGYEYECEFTLKNACDVDIFHDKLTKGEMEVIAPAGQKFVVTEKKSREISNFGSGVFDITQFVLVPAERSSL